MVWLSARALKNEQTAVIIPIHMWDKKQCKNYQGIFLHSLTGKVYGKCFEKDATK